MGDTARILEGKSAIVTGVTSGLGVGIAKVFAERGARVIGVARRRDRGERLAAEISKAGGEMRFVEGDLSRTDDCRRAVEGCLSAFGRADILVNNAAAMAERPVVPSHEVEEAEWDAVLDVNLKGAFFMCRHVLPAMREQKDGTILNIASMNAELALANLAAYNASKAGLVQLTRTLAVENVGLGVRANAILLGGVPSEMNEATRLAMGRMLRGPDWKPEPAAAPGGGMMSAEDVARTLSLLCTDDARLITGATIAVDGGATAGGIASAMVYLRCADLIASP